MNILLLGSGGREHAIAWKIAQSNQCDKLFVAPGNAGTASFAENVKLNPNDFDEVAKLVDEKNINMLVVGPEEPLVNGIVDYFSSKPQYKELLLVGPDRNAAQLEGSKDFAKQFMMKNNIPTAKYFSANKENINQALQYLETMKSPYVLKADGLAAGKGVLIIDDIDVAKAELKNMLNGKFGNAGNTVVIEEFLSGIECSVFVVTDGKDYVLLPEAKDYKRIGEGNTGLNTGGMGAVSPVPFFNGDFKEKVIEKIIKPTIKAIAAENMNYRGFVFFGLINVEGEPYVIEYNVRMGDPETEVVMPRIESDLVEVLKHAAKCYLKGQSVEISKQAASTVMMVSGGYPEKYEKGKLISGLDNVTASVVFHAGTAMDGNNILTSGGRVLAVTSKGDTIFSALKTSYNSIKNISFEKCYYRTDLGKDLQ